MSGLTTYHWIVIAVMCVGVLGLYFVPTVIAVSNRHPRRVPIVVLNACTSESLPFTVNLMPANLRFRTGS